MEDLEGSQWVNTMEAIYRLEGLPKMTSDDFLNLLGVPENKKDKWERGDRIDLEGLTKQDRVAERELTADPAGISIVYNNMLLTPFYVSDGIVWMDEELLEPIRRMDSQYLRFFLRGQKGRRMIAVKDGLILVAVIAAVKMSEDLAEKIETMWRQCVMESNREGVWMYENSDDDFCFGERTENNTAEPADAGHGGED
ncbi:hypothetical protein H9X85_10880 [Anaerotignum lactatifermentans]|uniref:Uncharacterized protein n=1 Tax=Anaerotignum lactatifermentans TaxID=160404 RepID=A0ABS2GBQ4_9FIRM|nr:hypothetical protein [Anaerotignum lactatifermentans]MBM6829993.1 hypothetical protein [Anaerotignum lactatifermentans]MBM6878585.1 hypothetical protein [Anaerotignum lactatifermentans]MBM6951702.1 hypothetical protein [Anaerotignum lactatifermentans]